MKFRIFCSLAYPIAEMIAFSSSRFAAVTTTLPFSKPHRWISCSAAGGAKGRLLADECADLDWKSRVEDLRRAAQSPETGSVRSVQRANSQENESEWDYGSELSNLRKQASRQVAQFFAEKLNASDFETEVSRLTSYVMNQAFEEGKVGGGNVEKLALVVLSLLSLHLTSLSNALAETEAQQQAERVAPSWLGPVVLGFPVVSYFLFNLYRDRVDPYAKLTDWMLGVGAMFIIGNLVTIATLGVRLY